MEFTHAVHLSALKIALQSALTYIPLCSAQSSQIFWNWRWKFPPRRCFFYENFPPGPLSGDCEWLQRVREDRGIVDKSRIKEIERWVDFT